MFVFHFFLREVVFIKLTVSAYLLKSCFYLRLGKIFIMKKIISRTVENTYLEVEVDNKFIINFITIDNDIVNITKNAVDLALDGYFYKDKSIEKTLPIEDYKNIEIGNFEYIGIISVILFVNHVPFELSINQFIELLNISVKNQIIDGIYNG